MRTFLLSLSVLPLLIQAACAADPWVLAFPELAADPEHAYFSGPQWTAVYTAQTGTMSAVPRDSLGPLPALVPRSQVVLDGIRYTIGEDGLIADYQDGTTERHVLPFLTADEVVQLPRPKDAAPRPPAWRETMGPLATAAGFVWIGLVLDDSTTGMSTTALGWFDPETENLGRVFGMGLAGFRPVIMTAHRDTVYMLLEHEEKRGDLRLMRCGMGQSQLVEVEPSRLGVPGARLLSMGQWGDTLLIATDEAVAVWKTRGRPLVWKSGAYAAHRMQWLYLKTFPGGDPRAGSAVRYLPMKSETPLEVRAKIDGWLQLVAPVRMEGYVQAEDWEQHNVLWSQRAWNCGSELCLARVRMLVDEQEVFTDLANTSLTYLGRDHSGVKVSFRALWAREEDLAPVLLAP